MKYFLFILILVIVILFNSLFILEEGKQVIITQFGNPVGGAIKDAGLHIKLPFVQKVHYFEKRILEWDGDPKQIPTADKRYIWLDIFSRWQIVDPLKFFQTVQMEKFAQGRLDDILSGSARDIVSANELIQVVRSTDRKMAFSEDIEVSSENNIISIGREGIEKKIFKLAAPAIAEYGIDLIDVKVKRVNYVTEVRQKVYERMISERQRIAEKYRSRGKGKKAEIDGKRQRELDNIESQAYKLSQQIVGEADAKATKIYANAYNSDPSFYQFIKTLETYKKTLNKKSTIILSTKSDFYKYLISTSPTDK